MEVSLRKLIIFCLFSLLLNTAVYGEQVNRIELTDRSVINGEIISYTNGIYTVKTIAFGEIKVPAVKIAKIERADSATPNSQASSNIQIGNLNQSEINAYGQKVMSNPDNAAAISVLANDSQIQEIAQDPQIQNAIRTGNIQALMKNEKFMSLVDNPKMQEAVKKIKQ